jgi:hypothetical protein
LRSAVRSREGAVCQRQGRLGQAAADRPRRALFAHRTAQTRRPWFVLRIAGAIGPASAEYWPARSSTCARARATGGAEDRHLGRVRHPRRIMTRDIVA